MTEGQNIRCKHPAAREAWGSWLSAWRLSLAKFGLRCRASSHEAREAPPSAVPPYNWKGAQNIPTSVPDPTCVYRTVTFHPHNLR